MWNVTVNDVLQILTPSSQYLGLFWGFTALLLNGRQSGS